jgi:hypothetical protein
MPLTAAEQTLASMASIMAGPPAKRNHHLQSPF